MENINQPSLRIWTDIEIEKVVLVTGGSRGIGEMIATVSLSINIYSTLA
jgi:NADP-dependent 3-hydroxy acid dehydrogenase YdfG